jgi:hypothetical protein
VGKDCSEDFSGPQIERNLPRGLPILLLSGYSLVFASFINSPVAHIGPRSLCRSPPSVWSGVIVGPVKSYKKPAGDDARV